MNHMTVPVLFATLTLSFSGAPGAALAQAVPPSVSWDQWATLPDCPPPGTLGWGAVGGGQGWVCLNNLSPKLDELKTRNDDLWALIGTLRDKERELAGAVTAHQNAANDRALAEAMLAASGGCQ